MIRVPGDKSISHRALLLAALSEGESRLRGLLPGEDCQSTARCLRALGVEVPELPSDGSEIRIRGVGLQGLRPPTAPLDCGNSGTTARLLLGVLAGSRTEAILTGDDSLRSRPMRRVTDPLGELGGSFQELDADDRLPIRVEGVWTRTHSRGEPLRFELPVASAQVKSALLLAGVCGGFGLTVVEPGRSRDHTERMLRRMGLEVRTHDASDGSRTIHLPEQGSGQGDRTLAPLDLHVPADLSSAAFLVALGLLRSGPPLHLARVGLNPTRTGLLPVLRRMGARIEEEDTVEMEDPAGEPSGTLVVHPSALEGTDVTGPEIPGLIDEVPLLAVLGARARGVTRIRGAEELRVKESDRIAALVKNLQTLGVRVEEFPDGLHVHGSSDSLAGRVRTFGDHRIAMAFGVLGALPGNDVEIDDPGVADVSFPGVWDHLARSGAPPLTAGKSRRQPMVITIDGPAGSGKSTSAQAVAARLELPHLDSGALYRAVTRALLDRGTDPGAWETLEVADVAGLGISLETCPPTTPRGAPSFGIRLDGRLLGEELRTDEVTREVPRVARSPAVRSWLLDIQRTTAARTGVVSDGRDMGTVVFPEATLKIYLVADPAERARRRLEQEGATESELTPALIRAEQQRLEARDQQDAEREHSPLKPADDAIRLDTTELSFEDQVEEIVTLARQRANSA